MSTKNSFIVGFMLIAMFFGAGNLIFPPGLGFVSGHYFWLAIAGFVLPGVCMPLIGVLTGSLSKDGYVASLKVVHPVFAIIFMVAIYLTIGPFFAIPRTATTSYEMSVLPFMGDAGALSLFIFSVIFFIIVFALSYKADTLTNSIGKVLTPFLLITIVALIVRAITLYIGADSAPLGEGFNTESPFSVGFTEGYLTMDA